MGSASATGARGGWPSVGVSLDEEATILIQFQRAYEANSRLITVLDQLSQATIDMLQP